MEQHLIYVYAAYLFTFIVLFIIGIYSVTAYMKANYNIENFYSESDKNIQKK